MGISQALLPEFDHEMANTRKTLERVPDDKFAWTPHPKSFPMGYSPSRTTWCLSAAKRHTGTIDLWTISG